MVAVAVIIPTLNAGRHLPALIAALARQSLAPRRILAIDSSSDDASATLAAAAGWQVEVIDRADFNHGGTRNRGAAACADADVLVFMTQDALPADDRFLANLVAPIAAGAAAATYARQVPYDDARPSEVFARGYNYAAIGHRRSLADVDRLGLRAYFLSNVASAVDRRAFEAVGRFPGDVVMNEDMLLCAKLLHAGEAVEYAADAVVRHSHNYSIAQQFRRYFDIGAFIAGAGGHIAAARAGGDGIAFALRQSRWLIGRGALGEAARSLVESAAKWLAFQLGKRERRLSPALKRRLSMHRRHW